MGTGKKDVFAADIFKAGIFKAGIVSGGGAPLSVVGGAIKNSPGCPCCEEGGCMWAEAHFTGESDLTIDWLPANIGDWLIDNSRLRTTATSSIILHRKSYPHNGLATRLAGDRGEVNPFHQHSVKAEFTAVSDRVILIVVTASDEANYVGLEISLKAVSNTVIGEMKLVSVINGVKTSLCDVYKEKLVEPGVTLYARIDFDDGEVRAVVSKYSGIESVPGVGSSLRSDIDSVQYSGDRVGIGVLSGSGEASFGLFEAGCSGANEHCVDDDENYFLQNTVYYDSDWEVMEGVAPTYEGGYVGGSDDVVMRKVNPISKRFEGNLDVYAPVSFPLNDTGTSWGIYIACDETFQNGYLCRYTWGNPDPAVEICKITDGNIVVVRSGEDIYEKVVTVFYDEESIPPRTLISFNTMFDEIESIAGRYVGYYAKPGGPTGTFSLNDFRMQKRTSTEIPAINTHWPAMEASCGGSISIDCGYCKNPYDWPTDSAIEFAGFTDGDCPASMANGLHYVDREDNLSGCYMDLTEELNFECQGDYATESIKYRQVQMLFGPHIDSWHLWLRVWLVLTVTVDAFPCSGQQVRYNYLFGKEVGTIEGPSTPDNRPDCNFVNEDLPFISALPSAPSGCVLPEGFTPLGYEGATCKVTFVQ